MRNMLQLLGGVAVAGAVAAGTTAFTASGLNIATGPANGITAGGAVSVNVDVADAKLMAATIVQDGTDFDKLTGVTITMRDSAGTNPLVDGAASKLKAKFAGSGGTGSTTTWAPCTLTGGTGTGIFTCNIPTGPLTTITAVQIAYVP